MAHAMELPRTPAPRMVRVKQSLPTERIEDVRATVRGRLLDAGLKDRVRTGSRIAITAGSRGMGGFLELLRGAVGAVKEAGGEPFLIPAMGSHGGATPEGQTEILHRLGVSEESVGAPIHATMETVTLGMAENGAEVHLDKNAAEADGTIVLGRVKTHPESAAALASGLLKMTTIGLGKQAGAYQAHSHDLWDSVRAVPKVTLAKGNVLFGVAVVENAIREPVAIEVAPADYDAFLRVDTELLETAKRFFPRIPFENLDVLIVDEIGKDVTGSGMDPNVIGRWRVDGGPKVPYYGRIVVLSLTPASLGNGIGIGFADFTTERFARAYDPQVTYINLLTASEPRGSTHEGPMPLILPTDREAIEVAMFSALASENGRVARIRSTARLEEFWVSEGMMAEIHNAPTLTLVGAPEPMPYNDAGNLF